MKNTCIWGFSYGPPYNEAAKNKINELSDYFGIHLITTGRINKLVCRNKNSIIFKRSIIGIILFMICSLWLMILKYKNIIIVQKPNSFILFFWSILLKNKIIHLSSNLYLYNKISDCKIYFKYIFPRLKYVGVADKEGKNIIDEYPHSRAKIFLFLPIVNTKKFHYVNPPEITQFKILFASAPLTEKDFDNKGMRIMLKGFKKFSKNFNSKLIIVWRTGKYSHLNLINSMIYLINELDLDKEVIIINEEVKNMHALYENSHVTILTNKNHDTPHYPQSLLEALSVGRPVITSKINEISDIILEENAGSICDLNGDSVYNALIDCYNNYSKKQTNARHVAEKYFDISNKTKQLEEILL